MATATYLCGAKTPYHFSLRSFCSNQPLKFASFGGACRRLQAPTSGGRRGLKVVCNVKNLDVLTRSEPQSQALEELSKQLSCVMKFGGSSVASAERMKEVADLILSFPEERPVIVLFAMGKTTNKLLVAGEKSASCVSVDISKPLGRLPLLILAVFLMDFESYEAMMITRRWMSLG